MKKSIQRQRGSSMGINRLLMLVTSLVLAGCQTSAEIPTEDIDRTLGNFLEVPGGWNSLYVDQHGDEFFFGSGDVPEKLVQCRNTRYEICVYSKRSLAFIVPKGVVHAGDRWTEFGFSFEVAKIAIDTAYIDVKLSERMGDTMRFFYKNGAVFGFSYGSPVTRENCYKCFDARITYIWTGDGGFRLQATE